MPDVSRWSIKEVSQLANLIGLKIETFGNGYVTSQSIDVGAPLSKKDYLAVELSPPGEEEVKDSDETEMSEE